MNKRKMEIMLLIVLSVFIIIIFGFQKSGFVNAGLFNINEKKYKDRNGEVLHGRQIIDKKRYYFDEETGIMRKGIVEIDDHTYYYGEDGVMVTGLLEMDNAYYYFDSKSGIMAQNAYKKIKTKNGSQISYFDSTGKMITESCNVNNKKIIVDKKGNVLLDYDKINQDVLSILNQYGGEVGIYFKDLRTNTEFVYNDSSNFYPCSIIKLCVLITVYEYINQGVLGIEECLPYLEPMIIHSDNDSYNILLTILGDGDGALGLQRVNEYMSSIGIHKTQLNHALGPSSYTFRIGSDNITCPSDIGLILEKIYRKEIITKEACDEMLDILLRCSDEKALQSGLPTNVPLANKSGWAYELYHDGGIVYEPNKDYILVIFTNNVYYRFSLFEELSNYFYQVEKDLFILE